MNYRDRFLPILTGTSQIDGLGPNWNFDAALNTVFRSDAISPARHTLQVNYPPPTVAQLQRDTAAAGTGLTGFGALRVSVRRTAQQITATAASTFDKARALQQWFTNPSNGFRYFLNVPVGDSGDALVDFLAQKQGFCQQYATAMAVMLRTLNIPSRVVIGFTQGALQADGSYLITSRNAHAWVEVPFRRGGWVRFDPTPPVDDQGGQQGYAASAAPPGSTTTVVAPAPAVTPPAREPGSGSGSGTPQVRDEFAPVRPAESVWPPGGCVTASLAGLVAAAVLLTAAFLPRVQRLRRRRRGLRAISNDAPGSAGIAWTEIEDTATDHGLTAAAGDSIRSTAHRISRRAQLRPEQQELLRQVVLAIELEWFAAGPAPQVTAPAQAQAAVVAAVIAGLQHHAPLPLRHRMLPPSHRGPRSAAGPVATAHPTRSAKATASAGSGGPAAAPDLKVGGRRWSG